MRLGGGGKEGRGGFSKNKLKMLTTFFLGRSIGFYDLSEKYYKDPILKINLYAAVNDFFSTFKKYLTIAHLALRLKNIVSIIY